MSTDTQRNVRVQILIPPRSAERLDRLVEQTESASVAEVVRNALRLYEAVIDADLQGRPLFQRIDGQMVPVLAMGPYAPPATPSIVVPMGTREEFEAADRAELRKGLAYIVLDPPAIRHFTDDGAWLEHALERDPDLDVSGYRDGEVRGDVDAFVMRIGTEGWRSRRDAEVEMEPFLKRVMDLFRRRGG